jgi:hypothetical protein
MCVVEQVGMPGENPEKAIVTSMNVTTKKLSPCLRLLIQMLLNEPITKNSEVSAASDIDSGEAKGRTPIHE